MVTSDYTYAISLCREDGTLIGQLPVNVDWEPAAQWARLEGIRHGTLSPKGEGLSTHTEPIWQCPVGEPVVSRLRVNVTEDIGQTNFELPITYLQGLANQASRCMVEKGILGSGERYLFYVLAYPLKHDKEQTPAQGITVKQVVPAIQVKNSKLEDYVRGTEAVEPEIDNDDIPIFVGESVLEEISILAEQAGAMETGGIMIGHIHLDESVPEIFLEVTGQIPAEHTKATTTKLTFTADTWTAIQARLKLRNKQESILGWWHCHNYLKDVCKDCPKANDSSCTANAVFMSSDDCALHRTCFPLAYSVALVVADSPCKGLDWGLFGWRKGAICHRDFYILRETTPKKAKPAEGVITKEK